MRNKKLLILFITFLLMMANLCSGCRRREKQPGEVIDYLKQLKTYSCKVEITIKNDRQEIKYDCKQYFDRNQGYRIEIGDDRIQIHKDNKIYVNDKKNSSKYTLDGDFDRVYSLSFIGNYIKLLYTEDKIKYDKKSEEGIDYQTVELLMTGNNRNMYKAVLYINAKTYKPEKLMVYDYKGNETVRMIYSDFKSNEEIDKNLFNVDQT